MHDENNYVFIGADKIIELTVKENKILSLLINNKGNIITYEQLSKLIYNDVDYYLKQCIKNKVFKLKKKLEGEVEILNVRQIGYKIPQKIYKCKNTNYCPICGNKLGGTNE